MLLHVNCLNNNSNSDVKTTPLNYKQMEGKHFNNQG